VLRWLIGLVLIGSGLYSALFSAATGSGVADFHRRWARPVPWLYRLPIARSATSSRSMRPAALAGGVLLVIVGIMFITGVGTTAQ
jgi:hypothetical protein